MNFSKQSSFGATGIRRLLTLSALCLALGFLLSCTENSQAIELYFQRSSGEATPIISAELALTGSQRKVGLMYRKEMAENQGMLFVFPTEEPQSFWMKNTYLELDMIFIDQSLKVVSIIHRAVPHSLTARPSKGPAKYVLEVVGGLATKWGIEPGDLLKPKSPIPEAQ